MNRTEPAINISLLDQIEVMQLTPVEIFLLKLDAGLKRIQLAEALGMTSSNIQLKVKRAYAKLERQRDFWRENDV